MSDESAQSTASEEESDCAWEFDASVLQCLETNAVDELGLTEYRPTHTDYSFKDEAAESLLLSLLQRKLVRLPQPPRLKEIWKTKEPDYCAYHRMLDHPTASCLVFKDQLQYFVNNHTLRLRPGQRALPHLLSIKNLSPEHLAWGFPFCFNKQISIPFYYLSLLYHIL